METTRGRRLLLGAIVAGLVVVSIELMLQGYYFARVGAFLFERIDPPLCEPDPLRCYRMKPDLEYEFRSHEFSTMIYTNSQGLRTDARRLEVPYEKAADAYRVLLLGPSFAFGWGSEYEDSFGALITGGLERPGRRLELINLGTIGQGHEPQLCWLREEGARFAPDLVVVTVYGSELPPVPGECPEPLQCPFVSEEGRLYVERPTLAARGIAVAKQLALVFYGYHLYQSLLPRPTDDAFGMGKELYSERERARLDPDGLGDAYAAYLDFTRRALGPETRVVFLFIPVSYVVHPEDAPRWSHLGDPSPARSRARIAGAAAALAARGIPLLDTTPALIDAAPGQRLYYWLDIHLTPAGNRIVADAALPALQALVDGADRGRARALP